MAIILSAVLLAGMTACGGAQDPVADTSSQAEDTSSEAVTPDAEADGTENAKIDDNGKPIEDFDEFVNHDWLEARAAADDGIISSVDESRAELSGRMRDMLMNSDISDLPEDDGFYKAVTIYREMMDTENVPERLEAIKSLLSRVENARTLDDMYKLYSDEIYAAFDTVFRFSLYPDSYGDYEMWYDPDGESGLLAYELTFVDGSGDPAQSGRFLAYTEALGYSDERISEMIGNAMSISDTVDEFKETQYNAYYYDYFAPEELEDVKVPVFDILHSLNALQGGDLFLANESFPDFLNELFVAGNVPALRDHMLINMIKGLYLASGIRTLEDDPEYDYETQVYSEITYYTRDVLAEEYMNLYLEDGVIEEMEVLFEDVKKAALEIVFDADWMSLHAQEQARGKFMRMKLYLGSNAYSNDLSDLTLTGNVMEDYLGLVVSFDRFRRSLDVCEDDLRGFFDANMLDVNGFYYTDYNSFVLTAGLLCSIPASGQTTYEERLATVGALIAHELSHSMDPLGINYDDEGYYEPWLSDEEQEAYDAHLEQIRAFFDGKDGGYRRTIDGSGVLNETFADILSVGICLQMLSERDDPDYDLFFRTLARRRTMYLTDETVDWYVDDSHLPGKLRINYIFGQFDIFYEIYDIDPKSPYYVREQDRLEDFWS